MGNTDSKRRKDHSEAQPNLNEQIDTNENTGHVKKVTSNREGKLANLLKRSKSKKKVPKNKDDSSKKKKKRGKAEKSVFGTDDGTASKTQTMTQSILAQIETSARGSARNKKGESGREHRVIQSSGTGTASSSTASNYQQDKKTETVGRGEIRESQREKKKDKEVIPSPTVATAQTSTPKKLTTPKLMENEMTDFVRVSKNRPAVARKNKGKSKTSLKRLMKSGKSPKQQEDPQLKTAPEDLESDSVKTPPYAYNDKPQKSVLKEVS